jgi:predicted MFS family arabinose efflux permease
MHTTLTPSRERWLLMSLAGIQFTHIVDFMIMMPLGPQLTALFAISDAQFGLLVSAYTLAAGAAGLFAAGFVDRFERKRLLLWLYGLFGLTTLACALAPSYAWLMLARIAAGVFGGILSAMTQTIIGDVIPFARRGRATGLVMTAFAMASVVGVPSGLFLANRGGWHTSFMAIAALCVLVGALAFHTLPQLNAHVAQAKGQSLMFGMQAVLAGSQPPSGAGHVSGHDVRWFFHLFPDITIYTQANHVLLPAEIPYVYLCGGVVTFFSSRWIGGLTDRVGKRKMFQRMVLLATLPMGMITLMQPMPLVLVLLVSSSFFFAMNGRMIPGHGLADLGGGAPVQRHVHVAQWGGAIGVHRLGLLGGGPVDPAQCIGPGEPFLALRCGGRGRVAAGLCLGAACQGPHGRSPLILKIAYSVLGTGPDCNLVQEGA